MEEFEMTVKHEGAEDVFFIYVDEHGTEQSVVTTVDNVVTQQLIVEETNIIPDIIHTDTEIMEIVKNESSTSTLYENNYNSRDRWTESETKRLLIFYIDNKETFVNGTTKKKHMWTVACKTMLTGKNATACEMKLRNMKRKYIEIQIEQRDGNHSHNWPFLQLCHQAFHDDPVVTNALATGVASYEEMTPMLIQIEQQPQKTNEDGIVVIKKVDSSRTTSDNQVNVMLQMYLNHKRQMKHVPKEMWQKGLWETIASELGVENAEYWHKRFLNFKQHYIRLLDKRQESGADSVQWPYMGYFDEIFKDDDDFQRKYVCIERPIKQDPGAKTDTVTLETDWDTTEMTVLVKYYFDCFHEFQDPQIPDMFLWSEVGRLLDRSPQSCMLKFVQMKKEHLENFTDGLYNLQDRAPLAILYDNIIAKEVSVELENESKNGLAKALEPWETDDIDNLVQFLYYNVDMLKDSVCYNVCWARLSKRLNRSVYSCKMQWDELKSLYKSILSDKKENPDMEIDWRYIELFDRIFDYGMNMMALLDGYDNNNSDEIEQSPKKKTVNIKLQLDKQSASESEDEDEDYGTSTRSKRKGGEAKAFKILEFYQKNKDMFSTSNRKKAATWEAVARQVGMTPAQCAHRFRNLKQVYMAYLHRECKSPEKPITWPYYALCKKVFGYRALKAKILKKDAKDFEYKEWSPKDIKTLITFYSQNYDEINRNHSANECWSQLAELIGKSENACREKFMELRKSYRKLKTMLTRNARTKVSWKYFAMFDEICSRPEGDETMHVEYAHDNYELLTLDEDIKKEIQEDDDIQCIIVIPEGQNIEEAVRNAELIPQPMANMKTELTSQAIPPTKWTKKTKKQLLILYLKYLRSHRDVEIDTVEMWRELATKLPDKTPHMCRKMLAKLIKNRMNVFNTEEVGKTTPYYTILGKILALKPQFAKKSRRNADGSLKTATVVNDVQILTEKVEEILEYYLEHLEEFLSPRYEKRKIWSELAQKVDEPMMKVYNKVMFLKNIYSKRDVESANEEIPFVDILERIFQKQKELKEKITIEKRSISMEPKDFGPDENSWSEEQTDQLLVWYLNNLDKFKNPKYVRSFLWSEASDILLKSPLVCSRRMSEIRTEYRTKVRETPQELTDWKFFDLCQKIYGTGRRSGSTNPGSISDDQASHN